MSFCPNCGGELPPGSKFCPRCGTKVMIDVAPLDEPVRELTPGSGNRSGYSGGSASGSGYGRSAGSGSSYGKAPSSGTGYGTSDRSYGTGPSSGSSIPTYNSYNSYGAGSPAPAAAEPEFGMKWFHFMIYFGMFAGILMCLANIGSVVSGYGTDAEKQLVYSTFPGMETADMVLIGGMIASAVLILIARFKLAGFKKDAIGWFVFAYGTNVVTGIAYIMLVRSALDTAVSRGLISEGDFSSSYTNVAVSLVMLIVNLVYLNNRKVLFKN